MKYLAFLLMLAGQFWETKSPADWSDTQLQNLLTDSPWAQMVGAPGRSGAQPVQVLIATSGPIEQAELEWDRRFSKKQKEPNTMKEEYRAWLNENRATQIVVAVAMRNFKAFSEDQEAKTMENESVMTVGRKKYKITGYFPPSEGDPYLRLAFPRALTAADKKVTFDLYIPGIGIGYRSAEFTVKDMIVNGKLEI